LTAAVPVARALSSKLSAKLKIPLLAGKRRELLPALIGATPLNSGIQPTGIAGFVNSGGIIGSIMNSVLGPDTRTEEEKAAALLLQQQQMERDNNRDSDQIRIPPNPVDPAPPGVDYGSLYFYSY
jgi:hypothetical protein